MRINDLARDDADMQATFREYVDWLQRRDSDEGIPRSLAGEELQRHGRHTLPAGFEELESSSDVHITILHSLADTSSRELAAILLVRVSPKTDGRSSPAESPFEFRRHVFCRFEGTTIASISSIDDFDALRNREAQAVRPPDWSGAPPPSPSGASLAQTYRSYFHCVATRCMEELPKYVRDHVVFNGHRVTREEYRAPMEECHDAMADCKNTLERLIVDEEKQQLAARVVFEWTPIRKWAGMEPTGRRVKFAEHVFVWFDEGRMHTSVTLLDMEAVRQQMGV